MSITERLQLERIDRDLFRGFSPDDGRPRVFGGQVAAQALVAAVRTIDERPVHSLHSYFLRPGDPKVPIIYEVDRVREGRSFQTRRVVAIQNGEAIFIMAASFQSPESGLDHQESMPDAAPAESVPSMRELIRRRAETDPFFERFEKMEILLRIHDLNPIDIEDPQPRTDPHLVWWKSEEGLPDDPLLHQCVLTYASDYTLLDAAIARHGRTWFMPDMMVASIDHAIWFHRPLRADQWLLYVTDSPSASGGRGLSFGRIYQEDGTLVASVAQEGLMRIIDPNRRKS